MWAVMIQECLVGYACKTGWKIMDSPSSVWDEVEEGLNVSIKL